MGKDRVSDGYVRMMQSTINRLFTVSPLSLPGAGRRAPNGVCLFWLTLALLAVPSTVAGSRVADSLHDAGWDLILDGAAHRPSQAFAFYAFRSLAVPHPEVYLLADSIFSDIVEDMPGTRLAFRGSDPRNLDLFRRISRGEQAGPAFHWRQWTTIPDSIHDPGGRDLIWRDLRLPPASVLLRADSPRLNTFEAAAMRYTAFRRTGEPADSLFVVIDAAGRGFLYRNSVLLSARTGTPVSESPSTINPAVVFNERHVFYPLMGRDDRPASPTLNRAVLHLGPPQEPEMGPRDHQRMAKLQAVAQLADPTAFRFAILAALGATDFTRARVSGALHDCFDDFGFQGHDLAFSVGMLRECLYWANHLSRPAAALAAIAVGGGKFAETAPRVQAAYLDLAGRRRNPDAPNDSTRSAWGYLWSYELLDIVFDDVIRTRAGGGSAQALAMSAILDLAGIANTRLELDMGVRGVKPEQHWVLTQDGRWQFNMGEWLRVPEPNAAAPRVAIALVSVGKQGNWVDFLRSNEFCDWEDLLVAHELTRIASVMPQARVSVLYRDDDAAHDHGAQADRHPTHARSGKLLPLAEVTRQLVADEVYWRQLPWPPIGTTRAVETGQGY